MFHCNRFFASAVNLIYLTWTKWVCDNWARHVQHPTKWHFQHLVSLSFVYFCCCVLSIQFLHMIVHNHLCSTRVKSRHLRHSLHETSCIFLILSPRNRDIPLNGTPKKLLNDPKSPQSQTPQEDLIRTSFKSTSLKPSSQKRTWVNAANG